jgi:hypothetical protein
VPERYFDVEPEVLVFARIVAEGGASGFRLDREVAHLWSIRDGRVAGVKVYLDRAEASKRWGWGVAGLPTDSGRRTLMFRRIAPRVDNAARGTAPYLGGGGDRLARRGGGGHGDRRQLAERRFAELVERIVDVRSRLGPRCPARGRCERG